MVDDGARAASVLRNDLEGHLTLFLLEATGESRTPCDDFAEILRTYPEIRVLHRRLAPDLQSGEIESAITQALSVDVDVTLVWAAAAGEDSAWYRQWPSQALAAAESVNLFEKCLVALAGEDVQQREARRLGYEDGITASMPLDTLVIHLAREVVAHREARRQGSSPPCYL